ncbi:peptidoglycan editing factor PgeF [Phytoactinopolyspora halotolerans]|uniref:Purine nucleoside phosphorylase n=1 Tax=Phytoactinopolyspora halotolerans TaxID=1981512 RepID=A0A6L9SDF3_9ACTN|nr:peptidoglycan editing factor PgeF [Phytoactinopolyspora halotolerans]
MAGRGEDRAVLAHLSSHGRASFAFTDRAGGVSRPPFDELNLARHVGDDAHAVESNRSRLAESIGLPADRVVYMNQVHGADVAVVDGARPWRPEEAPPVDAMVTTQPGVALAVMVADCVPVLLADAERGVVGVAHAGRPGLAAGVVPAVVAAMRELGADRLDALIGPSVCGACYEVPETMRDEVAAAVPAAWATTRQGTPAVDVPAGVLAQLRALDVRAQRVSVRDAAADPGDGWRCTLEDPAFFSYRRDRTTGRFAGLVWTHE